MKVEPALQTTLLLPTWKPMEKKHTENPAYDFIKRFVGGRESIRWTIQLLTVSTNDPVWLHECCSVVAGLSRAELCVMHVYTTQAYTQITHFLRGTSVKSLGLIHSSDEWKAGENQMLNNVRHKNKSGFLSAGVNPGKLHALLTAWRAPRSEGKYKICRKCYAALRPHFTKKFLRVCKSASVRNHVGVVYSAQSGQTLPAFLKAIPILTCRDWHRILLRFVADLDAIFAKMPQCKKAFYLYRGEGKAKGQAKEHPSFTSTSLDQDTARYFAKPTLLRITAPVGSRVLPLLCISRYQEQEVLLPCDMIMNQVRNPVG